MKKIIIILCGLILLVSCEASNREDYHQLITIVNKTNKTFYIDWSTQYPDVNAYKSKPNPALNGFSKVSANETTDQVFASKSSYESIFKYRIPSGVMMIYVFDGSTLETQGWDYIKNNNLVYKRYDLTLQDLNNMNWTLTID